MTEFVGNEHARGLTTCSINNPKGPIMLSGPYGVGKRTFLLETLKEKIGSDFIIEPDSSAESIRDACSECSIAPSDGYFSLVITDVQRLSDTAQDSLLKILEEPKPGVVVFLVSDDGGSISQPILSRIRTDIRWVCVPDKTLEELCNDEFHSSIAFGSPSLCLASLKVKGIRDLYDTVVSENWPTMALTLPVPEIIDNAKPGSVERILVANVTRLASRISPHRKSLLSFSSTLCSVPSASASLHWLNSAVSAM